MLDRGNYFSGQTRDEKVVLFIRQHWPAYLFWRGLILIFLLIITPVFVYYVLISYYFNTSNLLQIFSQKPGVYWVIILYSIWYLMILAFFLNSWLNFYLNITIVTTGHLINIRQDGLFNHKAAEQNLLQVQDVSSYMRGILQTFFRYGKVLVETAGDQPNFEISNIPKPYKVANTIMKLHYEVGESTKHDSFGNRKPNPEYNSKDSKIASEITKDKEYYDTNILTGLVDNQDYSDHPKEDIIDIDKKMTNNQLEGDLEEGKSIEL